MFSVFKRALLTLVILGPTLGRAMASDFPNVTLEDPKDYTLSELRDLTRKQNFELREELHNLNAAKANMQMHYENLLPHLTMNSISGVAGGFNPLSLLSLVGDLLPFLLPNRWAEASEAKHLYLAEQLGARIAQEDAIELVEGLAFAVMRDEDSLLKAQSLKPKFGAAFILVQKLIKSKKLSEGRDRNIESPILALNQTISSLQDVVNADLIELASAVGFINPLAIRTVVTEPFADLTLPPVEELGDLENLTLQTAPEVEQMNEFIASVQANERERRFDWLDPSGDPQGGLGAGLPAFLQIGKENIEIIKTQAEQMKADLLKRSVQAIDDYNSAIDDHGLAIENAALQEARYNRAIAELNGAPNDTPVGDLNDTLNQWPAQSLNIISTQYVWYTAISRINRLKHRANFARP